MFYLRIPYTGITKKNKFIRKKPKEILVTLGGTDPSKTTLKVIEALKDLKEFNEIHLVVKLHPAELDAELYKKLAEQENISTTILDGKQDTFEAIASSDFFSTMTSTVALEAMMFNKPVFIFNFANYGGANDWVKEKAVTYITNRESGKKEIKRVLSDKRYLDDLLKREKNFLKKHYYKIDGKATERLYELIKNNINQPK